MFDLENSEEPEREKALLWQNCGTFLAGLAFLAALVMLWPLAQLVEPVPGTAPARPGLLDWAYLDAPLHYFRLWLEDTGTYLGRGGLQAHPGAWWPVLRQRFWTEPMAAYGLPHWAIWVSLLGPFAFWALWDQARTDLFGWETRFKGKGSAKWSTEVELRKAGLFAPYGLILGRTTIQQTSTPSGRRRGHKPKHLLRNWETLSGILISPPGTGKTVQLATQLLADWNPYQSTEIRRFLFVRYRRKDVILPAPSMIVNDPKGELYNITSAHRARLGPVIRLALAETDPNADSWNPLDPSNYPGGAEALAIRRTIMDTLARVYAPAAASNALVGILRLARDRSDWMAALTADPMVALDDEIRQLPLVHRLDAAELAELARVFPLFLRLNEIYSERESFIAQLAAILVPETVEQHWKVTGRAALEGFIGFTIARHEHDPVRYQASFGALLDWLNGTTGGKGFSDPSVKEPMTGPGGEHEPGSYHGQGNAGSAKGPTGGDAEDGDLTAKILDEAIGEARANGYPERVINDLNELRMKPDRERGSVISTAGGSINVFKNAAVRARTSHSTFRITDLRGVVDAETGRLLPVTVYVDVPIKSAESLGRVTGLFFQVAVDLSLSEKDPDIKRKQKAGLMTPIVFLIDEFWTLPALRSNRDLPNLGRGYWMQMLIVGQTRRQIASKYGSDGNNVLGEIEAGAHYKIVPAQNDFDSAEAISKLLGNKTVRQTNVSRQKGFSFSGKDEPFRSNESESTVAAPLIRPDEIMRLEKLDSKKDMWGWQIVRFGQHNVVCRPAAWFDVPMLERRKGRMQAGTYMGPKLRDRTAAGLAPQIADADPAAPTEPAAIANSDAPTWQRRAA